MCFFATVGWTDKRRCQWWGRRRYLLPVKKESVAALRVLGDHLHCDGLHFRVLLQAAFSPEKHTWQTTGNGDDAANFCLNSYNLTATVKHSGNAGRVGLSGGWGYCCNILLDKDLYHVKQLGKVGFQNKKSGLVILWLICVYSVGRRPSHTHNSRPLPDILYPPNGHCVLRALKQFILRNTQNIDQLCDNLSKAVASRKTELIL